MSQDTLYVGLDTDKKHIDVAVAEALPGGEVRYWGKVANEASAVARLVKRLQGGGRRLEMSLRGFALINAATLVVEIGDPRRFAKPSQLMAYLGLVPSEHSTGDSVRRGGLTKTGNGRTRKALIEAAWTYSRPARAPRDASRHAPAVTAIATKAGHRLSRRYRQLTTRGKRPVIAVAAIARELSGFVWAIAQVAGPPAATPESSVPR
jgi:transposase